ncbi:unnamed protein product [Zymoseptoria tritici ST99CH_3D1]|nr:unnamed protein product [Zymoseptoria tritici ST99CH_3D1]
MVFLHELPNEATDHHALPQDDVMPATPEDNPATSKTMRSLPDLPTELIIYINSLIPRPTWSPHEAKTRHPYSISYQLYCSLSLVCKRLHSIIRPILYENIAFKDVRYLMNDKYKDKHQIARTLCEAPHLQEHVRKLDIEIHGCSSYGGQELVKDEAVFPSLRQTLMQTLGERELCEKIMYILRFSRCQAAYAAILVLLAPNVKELAINFEQDVFCAHPWEDSGGLSCMQRLVGMMFEELQAARLSQEAISTTRISPLENLQDCTLHDTSPITMASIMSIPSMRSVKASFMKMTSSWQQNIPDFEAVPSGVTSLELIDYVLDPRWVKTIVAGCRALKHFTYQVRKVYNFDDPIPPVNATTIREALDSQKHALETLRLIDSTKRGQVFTYSEGSIGSLADFSSLTHLEIDEQALFAFDARDRDDILYLSPHFISPNMDFLL